jgi:signal transduction histidine kinase
MMPARQRRNPFEKINRATNSRLREKEKINRSDSLSDLTEIATLVHDIKSPAQSIIALGEILKRRHSATFETSDKEICRVITETATQILTIATQMGYYAAAKESPLKFELLELAEIFDLLGREFALKLEKTGVVLKIPPAFPKLVGDKLGLIRAFRNLLDNAIKYGGDCLSKIEIRYANTSTHHVIIISNDGEPIREEDRKKIFESFQRCASKRKIPGSGLGLTIVKEIAKKHRGCIRLDPHAPVTSFHFSISKQLVIS